MEILTFLSRHHPPPIDMKKAIHRVSRNVMWRIRTLVEGTDTGRDSLGKQSRRKRIIQPFIIFYSLAPGLLAYVAHHLGAHHASDVCHVQHALCKTVAASTGRHTSDCRKCCSKG